MKIITGSARQRLSLLTPVLVLLHGCGEFFIEIFDHSKILIADELNRVVSELPIFKMLQGISIGIVSVNLDIIHSFYRQAKSR